MKKIYTLSFILLASLSFGQISITAINSPYDENFDAMGADGTNFLNGWTAVRSAGSGTVGATLAMVATDGSANSGNIYNTGTTSATERSFGTLASGSTVPAFGASFINNTGSTVSTVTISAMMEQWRESSNALINETVSFSYSLNATSLSTGTWTAVTGLDLLEKLTAATTNLAVNGNLAANQTAITSTISGLTWANGTTLWIKWVDTNDAGSDGIYSIDNFAFNATAGTLSLKKNEITGLSIYPNPVTNGTLYITSNSNSEKSVTIFDVLGKQILGTKTSNSTVNVSSLKGGSYVLKITEEGKTVTKKIIIE